MGTIMILTLVYLPLLWASAAGKQIITIAGILSSESNRNLFARVVDDLNRDTETKLEDAFYNSTTSLMDPNPIRSAWSVCEDILPEKVYVVVVSHPPNDRHQPPISVSYICGFYKIPVIGITARDSVFTDANLHTTYLRTVPPYSHQAKVWVDVVRHFKWNTVVLFHSADHEGRGMVTTFQNEIGEREGLIAKVIDYQAGQKSYIDRLRSTFSDDTQVFLLSATKHDAEVFFKNIEELNMTDPGYVWILTQQALEASNVPSGALGLMLRNSDEQYHIQDSVKIAGKAIKSVLSRYNMTVPPDSCTEETQWDESGTILYEQLIQETLNNGLTGQVSFDSVGDRLRPVYEIHNVHGTERRVVGQYVGEQGSLDTLQINDSALIWPGGQKTKPTGIKILTHLKVVTIESIPFVFTRKVESESECNVAENELYCPLPNFTDPAGDTPYCCRGYCIDMLTTIAQSENFTFELHLVADGKFGTFENHNGSSTKVWNGMIGELLNKQANLILGPMTIDPERANYIEFTKPFKYQGLTVLVKKEEKNSSLGSFLQPFQDTLWVLVGLSVHVVALVLYLLDRFSPFGRFKLARGNENEEDALNLSSAMWFAWGVLLNSGIGEGTPRSFSARVLGMVWAGFAMIIVASYTANLAAFLVLDRPTATITGKDDVRLRNPQQDYTYGSVKNSAVLDYFRRRVELSTMYRTMDKYNKDTPEEAIDAVRNRKLNAFIWDSTRLEYEAARDCELVTVGELFGRSGFGIGLRKKSPWIDKISLKILNMHERGAMEKMDGKWIVVKGANCPQKKTSPATLGLTNMAGVFMLVAGGIITGVVLIFVEIAYRKHRGMKEKELSLARNAADRWRGNIEKRKTLRQTLMEEPTSGGQTSYDTRPNGRTDSPAVRMNLEATPKQMVMLDSPQDSPCRPSTCNVRNRISSDQSFDGM